MSIAEKWRGKTALVTGASSGIGAAIARLLAADGCHLIVTARRRERLVELQQELVARHGVRVDVLAHDLAQPGAARALYDAAAALGGPIDLLIANAGFGVAGTFRDNAWAREQEMIQLNVLSLVELTKLVLPGMVERRAGDILLVSSIAAFLPIPTFAVYAATKAFVTRFGEALGHELAATGVGVTVLNPAGTATEFLVAAGLRPTRVTQLGLMPAEAVARIGLRALARRRRSVIAGVMNKVMIWCACHLLPLGLRLRAAAAFQRLAGGGGG